MRRLMLPVLVLMCTLAISATAQVVITPEGFATMPGPYYRAPVFVPVLVTPTAHLATPRPGVGAAAAAPGQQVGATSAFPNQILTPSPPTIVPQVVGAAPMIILRSPKLGPMLQTPMAPTGVQPTERVSARDETPAALQQQGGAVLDLGVAPVQGVGRPVDGRSLAQAAAAQNGGKPNPSLRTITNEDIQRLNQQTPQGTPNQTPSQQSTPAQ